MVAAPGAEVGVGCDDGDEPVMASGVSYLRLLIGWKRKAKMIWL